MIKIVFLIPSLSNIGPTNQLYYILKHLDYSTFDVSLLNLSAHAPKKFTDLPVNLINFNFTKIQSMSWGIIKIKHVIKSIQPQLIHSHLFRADFISAFFFNKYKRISTVRGEVTSGKHYILEKGLIVGLVYSYIHRLVLTKINNIVAVSSGVLDSLRENLLSNTTMIANSIDTHKHTIPSRIKKLELREKIGVNFHQDTKIFIMIGSLIERKKPEMPLQFFNKFNNQKAALIILGDGTLKEKLMQKYTSDNIVFFGFKNNIDDYLRASDFLISNSEAEGLPNSVLEAMAYGLPSILSDIKPHIQLIPPKYSDFIFKQDDIDNFGSKIIFSLNLKSFSTIQNDFQNHIIENYSALTMATQYKNLYLNILKEENI